MPISPIPIDLQNLSMTFWAGQPSSTLRPPHRSARHSFGHSSSRRFQCSWNLPRALTVGDESPSKNMGDAMTRRSDSPKDP